MRWGIDAKTLSGGENPYDVTWTSSATDVLTAEQTGDDNTQGTITGIKAGKADVIAEVAGVSSERAEVKVDRSTCRFGIERLQHRERKLGGL